MNLKNTLDALKNRRSVRGYACKPIPREILEEIIECARFAPTANDVQPWEFVVVTEQETLKKLAAICEYGKFIKSAGACVLVLSQNVKYYLEDCSAATENILLAAANFGVGSCWVAGDKKPYCADILALVGAPAELKLVSVLALGYPRSADVFRMAKKRALKDVLHWERF